MNVTKKLILIGWDAADWKVINPLMDSGKMPNLQKMVESGTSGNIRTLQPVLSPMLWTSIATGKRPYKHGIYGFTEPTPDKTGVRPMTNVSRQSKAIWNILNQNQKRSVVVGWWPSHPAEPINGLMISDYFHKAPRKPGEAWPFHNGSVHPTSDAQRYAELRVHPQEMIAEDVLAFVPKAREIDQDNDARLSMIMRLLAEVSTNHATATEALETEDWDFAAIYYDAIDHFCHGFMKYHPPQQKIVSDKDFELYKDVVNTCYIFHDALLGRLLDFADENTTTLLISDHGFHPDHLRPKVLPSEPAGPAAEHRDYGIFVAQGPGIKKDHLVFGANLLDVAPTVLTHFGLPVGDDMDGKPLVDIFEDETAVESIPSWQLVDGEDGQHPEGFAIDEKDADEAMEQLIELGYIERPDADPTAAIKNCQKELDYNLARSYMDGSQHGHAIPLLFSLYEDYPTEFRFGVQLASCLLIMGQHKNLKRLLENMEQRWKVASLAAKESIKEIGAIAKERRKHWKKMKAIEEQQSDPDAPELIRRNVAGKAIIFTPQERHTIKQIRAVAGGNPQTLDLLAASVAMAEEDFDTALERMELARVSESGNPNFFFRLGDVYRKLGQLDKAEETFNKGLSYDDLHPQCLMGLASVFHDRKQFQKSLQFAKKAIGLMHFYPVGQFWVGVSHLQLGEFKQAAAALELAIKQNPNFAEAHERLQFIYSGPIQNAELESRHREAAEELKEMNSEVVDEAPSLEFTSWTREQIAENLPKFLHFEENDEFVRCLGQPIQTDMEKDATDSELPEIVIVSGLPRSGTSMMMQMLKAAGLEVFTDGNRIADESNPLGYYEADIVTSLQTKNRWLLDCHNKLVKVVSPLIPSLPQQARYKVLFMNRNLDEIVTSQLTMLERLGKKKGEVDPEKLKVIFQNQNYSAVNSLLLHGHAVCQINFSQTVSDPITSAKSVCSFLGLDCAPETLAAAVAPDMYRVRK